MPLRIQIACPQKRVPIDRRLIRKATRAALGAEGISSADIGFAFVDNRTIALLNRRFLDHDGPTDVITFPLGSEPIVAEIVVGAEVALAQSQARGHDVQAELALYVIHGLLHLCGYDDHRAADRATMRRRERHCLRLLGLRLK